MAATVLEWANPHPVPESAFVDTQFLIDLHNFYRGPAVASVRESAAKDFLDLLVTCNTELWVTPCVIQEMCWKHYRVVEAEVGKKQGMSKDDATTQATRRAPDMYTFVLWLKALVVRFPGETGAGPAPGSLVAKDMWLVASKH